jgi:hypothetical protein
MLKFYVSENSFVLLCQSSWGGRVVLYHMGVILNACLPIRISLCKRILCSGDVQEL